MYAAPDCPEVYFLARLRNPTKTLFEFWIPACQPTEKCWQRSTSVTSTSSSSTVVRLFPVRSRRHCGPLSRCGGRPRGQAVALRCSDGAGEKTSRRLSTRRGRAAGGGDRPPAAG